MDVHVCALSSMAMIIYVLSRSASHSTLHTFGEAFQQSLITHHKF